MKWISARDKGLLLCNLCHTLNQAPSHTHGKMYCSKCGARLHQRKPHSMARSWSISIAGAIALLIANILPIMTVKSLGQGEPDTIISGVILLIQHKMYPVAIVVFLFSVAVPVCKLLALWGLLISVQRHQLANPIKRTVLYRMVEWVGKWSMLDIFVIAILVALVNLGSLVSIEAGNGASAFCLAVVLTMFAAQAFDPRLIWDEYEAHQ